jgi:thymidylate synthase
MSNSEQSYLDLLKYILKNGTIKEDRTGTGTLSVFGYTMKIDLNDGFFLATTKKVPMRLISSELNWFIKGDTNIRYLLQHNNNIWIEWAIKKWFESEDYKGPDMSNFGLRSQIDNEFNKLYEEQVAIFIKLILTNDDFAQKFGDLGNIYGKQWRRWETSQGETIDQLKYVIEEIKINPDSRRLLVVAFNPGDVIIPNRSALPACHCLFQFYVSNNKLSCLLYQRSGDAFLGITFNMASYSLLTHMIAKECGLGVGEFIHVIGDAHIYLNHLEQVNLQLSREMRNLPTLKLNPNVKSIFDYEVKDIEIEGYNPHPTIKAPVAI